MSFSTDVKNEISKLTPDKMHCVEAELAAMIIFSAEITNIKATYVTTGDEGEYSKKTKDQILVTLKTENRALTNKYLKLIRKLCDIETNLEIIEYASGSGRAYSTELFVSEETKEIADIISRISEIDNMTIILERIADCCCRAFIRGAFLAAGALSDPGKSYHFEIACKAENVAENLCTLFHRFDVSPKIVLRKGKYVVYLKDSEQIVSALGIIGAGNALMQFENIRIIKEIKNSANRQFNCDSANINKIVKTAQKQVDDIIYIRDNLGFSELNAQLKEMALVRLAHPEEPLKDLGEYLNPPVGKSGVNHRLKKLSEIADDLRKNKLEI